MAGKPVSKKSSRQPDPNVGSPTNSDSFTAPSYINASEFEKQAKALYQRSLHLLPPGCVEHDENYESFQDNARKLYDEAMKTAIAVSEPFYDPMSPSKDKEENTETRIPKVRGKIADWFRK